MTPDTAPPATGTLAIVKRFLILAVRELRWRLGAALVLAIGLAFAEGAGLLLLIPLLQSIGLTVDDGKTGALATSVARLFAAAGLQLTLPAVLTVFVFVSTAHAVLYRAHLLLYPTLDQRLATSLRERLYAAMVGTEWSFFITRRNSDIVHAVTVQVDRVSAALYQLLTLTSGLAVSLVYTAVAFKLSPVLTMAVIAAGGALLWAIRRRTQRSSELGETYSQADREQFHMAAESIAGMKVAKTFGAERRDAEIFSRLAHKRADAYLDMLRAFARAKLRLDVSSALLISVLLLVAVEGFGFRGAGLLVLIFVFARVMPRVVSLQESFQIVVAGMPAFQAVVRMIEDGERHAEKTGDCGSGRVPFRREVRVENVSYTYSGATAPVLESLSLVIPAGRMTAIVGASGAGKSTLADILIGLLRPVRGRVLVDGLPLAPTDIAAWRRSVGYVPQESFLLHDTIRANLRWARPEATEEEMWEALDRAAAAEFVRLRVGGLDSVVGDRGVRLSGGERQRLGLARALLTRPDLLVLDEATSALDSINERQILTAVQGLAGRVTTLLITHRLSAIRGAELIHVVAAGRILESGSWQDLASKSRVFAELLVAQGLEASPGLVHTGVTFPRPTRAAI